MPKVAICTPTLGACTWTYHDSKIQSQAYTFTNSPSVETTVMRPPRTLAIHTARQWLAEQVMEQDHDYLWFVDQDAAFVPGTLERLLSRDVPVVGGLTMIRSNESPHPMLYRDRQHRTEHPMDDAYSACAPEMFDWIGRHFDHLTNEPQMLPEPPRGSLFRVDFTGCHCTLIRRDVFETIPKPWFYGSPGTEDKWFCLRCNEYGLGVYIDLSVLVGHTAKEHTVGALDFLAHNFYRSQLESFEKRQEEADSEASSQRRGRVEGDRYAAAIRGMGAGEAGPGPDNGAGPCDGCEGTGEPCACSV